MQRVTAFLLLLLTGALACESAAYASPHGHRATRMKASSQSRSTRLAHPVKRNATVLQRTRRKRLRLRPVEPVTTALIDPVPRGRFPFLPPLRGSHEALLRQNARSEADGLKRILDDADLLSLRQERELIAIPATTALLVDERLPANRRFCRLWAAQFLGDFPRVHYGRFHKPLQVNSAVRTVEFQRHLGLRNGNAAPAEGDDASPHLTGATIDVAKKGLSMNEVGWMRAYLAPLQAAGKIDVEEEFQQACFHITVYRSYHPGGSQRATREVLGGTARGNAALLAIHIH